MPTESPNQRVRRTPHIQNLIQKGVRWRQLLPALGLKESLVYKAESNSGRSRFFSDKVRAGLYSPMLKREVTLEDILRVGEKILKIHEIRKKLLNVNRGREFGASYLNDLSDMIIMMDDALKRLLPEEVYNQLEFTGLESALNLLEQTPTRDKRSDQEGDRVDHLDQGI